MSSFGSPHNFYLFTMSDGQKKLAWGSSVQEAIEILGYRLSVEDLQKINEEDYIRISQREIVKYIHLLG